MLEEDLNNRFSFHPIDTQDKQRANEDVRRQCYVLALYLDDLLPEGREKSLAITKLEEVLFWSHASIARDSLENEPSTGRHEQEKEESQEVWDEFRDPHG